MPTHSTHNKVVFLTNYALVLLVIRDNPEARMRDISSSIGITERAVQRLVDELVANGYLLSSKSGRRNSYEIDPEKSLGLPFSNCALGELLNLKAISTLPGPGQNIPSGA